MNWKKSATYHGSAHTLLDPKVSCINPHPIDIIILITYCLKLKSSRLYFQSVIKEKYGFKPLIILTDF